MFQGLQNGAIRGLQIEADFRDYKSCQEGLESVAAYGISNRGKKISKQCRDFRLGQRDFKSWQEKLQTRTGILNWGRYNKSMQNHLIKIRQNWLFFIIPLKQNYSAIGSSGKKKKKKRNRQLLFYWRRFLFRAPTLASCILSQCFWYSIYIQVDKGTICFISFSKKNDVNYVSELFITNGSLQLMNHDVSNIG